MTTHRNRTRFCERGLTMIEVIIAVSILAIVIGVSYRALTQIMTTKQLLDDERDARMISNAVINRMTREISLAIPNKLLPKQEGGNEDAVRFRSDILLGTPESGEDGARLDSISFMAENAGQYVPDGKTHSGIVQISYRVEEDPEQDRHQETPTYFLVRDEIPDVRPLSRAYENRMTFPITNKLLQLKFRFYDKVEEQWRDKWSRTQEGLPALILMNIKLLSPNGKEHSFTTMVHLGREFNEEED